MATNPVKMTSFAVVEIWEKRTIILSAFGLVGFGALVGAGSIYYFFLKNKIEERFQLQTTTIANQINQLRYDVDEIRESVTNISEKKSKAARKKDTKSLARSLATKRHEQKLGYTTDNDEFMTATSDELGSSSSSDEDLEGIKIVGVAGEGDGEDTAVQQFFEKIDILLEGSTTEQHEAFIMLKSNAQKLKNFAGFWLRLAKATFYEAAIAEINGDKELRKTLIFTAHSHADKALKMDDFSSEIHKWYAITIGSKGEFLSVSEKIQNGFVFKEHIDRAVELNPKDSSLHYLLGRFCFEVSQLSWFEKKAAATLFSAPPTATPKEALDHFLAAERLGKPFKENHLYIAKCYVVLKDPKSAAKYLSSASDLPIKNPADQQAQIEISTLLKKYKSYLG